MSYLKSQKLKRQLFAYEAVIEFSGNKKEYKSIIESLGMKIYNNGLSSTLAVLKSDTGTGKIVYDQIQKWIEPKQVFGFSSTEGNDLLLKVLEINDAMVLSALTKEILAFSDALKEIVKAEIKI